MSWQLQDAKNKLSLVVKQAQTLGPQVITVRGHETAVVLSTKDYQLLTQQKKGNLVDFFQQSPWANTDIDVTREKDFGRDVEL